MNTRYAEGIRTSKTVNNVTTDFYLDGANVIAETKNNETTNYIRGATGIVYSEILGSGNSRKYYTSDGHGNITNLINTNGSVVKSYTYDAFGVEENIDSADTNPFRYCGEYYDSEINQIYLRARYYAPSLGRFNQSDPAMADGYNWYVYCKNNPVNYIDPLGLALPKASDYPDETKYRQACLSYNEKKNSIQGHTNTIWSTDETISYTEIDGNIYVYSYISFDDKLKSDIYSSDNAIYAIESTWSGRYLGQNIKVEVVDVSSKGGYIDYSQNPSFKFTINDYNNDYNTYPYNDKSFAGVSRVHYFIEGYLLNGDYRNNYLYTKQEFMQTVAHEFGHVLGIGDLYLEPQNFQNIISGSIMGQGQFKYTQAQPADYYMMMKSLRTRVNKILWWNEEVPSYWTIWEE